MDAITQVKLINSLTILDEILRCQISPKEKTWIGCKGESHDVYDKGDFISKQKDTSYKIYIMITRHKIPTYANSFNYKINSVQ